MIRRIIVLQNLLHGNTTLLKSDDTIKLDLPDETFNSLIERNLIKSIIDDTKNSESKTIKKTRITTIVMMLKIMKSKSIMKRIMMKKMMKLTTLSPIKLKMMIKLKNKDDKIKVNEDNDTKIDDKKTSDVKHNDVKDNDKKPKNKKGDKKWKLR